MDSKTHSYFSSSATSSVRSASSSSDASSTSSSVSTTSSFSSNSRSSSRSPSPSSAPAPRLLLTGGAGFVGSAIVKALADIHPSWRLYVVDCRPADTGCLPSDQLALLNKKVSAHGGSIEYFQADILNPAEVHNIMRNCAPDAIVHIAGLVPGGLSRYNTDMQKIVHTVNVDATRVMLDVAKKIRSVRAFVLTSSSCTITDDLDSNYPNFTEEVPMPEKALIYGTSKGIAEKMVLAANDPANKFYTTAIRPSAILGREDYQLIPSIHACIAKHETPFIIGTGDNLYDFTFIDNVAWSHILAVENLLLLPLSSESREHTTDSKAPLPVKYSPVRIDEETKEMHPSAAGLAINISNAQIIPFRDFCLAVWAQFDHVPPFTMAIPARLAQFVGLASECVSYLTGIRTTLCRGSVKDAFGIRYCDLTRARSVLGYEPIVDLWDGVKISCDAFKQRLEHQQQQAKLVK